MLRFNDGCLELACDVCGLTCRHKEAIIHLVTPLVITCKGKCDTATETLSGDASWIEYDASAIYGLCKTADMPITREKVDSEFDIESFRVGKTARAANLLPSRGRSQ